MERKQVIEELKQFFHIKELVCNHTFERFGEKSWQFLDTEYLETLLVLRTQILKVPMVCNTSSLKQRGLRCNICQLVKGKTLDNQIYLSAHVNGAGGDFSSPQMSAATMRQLIVEHQDLLPHRVRIERGVNWLHIDVYEDPTTDAKVVQFNG